MMTCLTVELFLIFNGRKEKKEMRQKYGKLSAVIIIYIKSIIRYIRLSNFRVRWLITYYSYTEGNLFRVSCLFINNYFFHTLLIAQVPLA